MQRYMIRPIQHGLDLSYPSLTAPFSHAHWGAKNFRVSQRSAQKRWGYNTHDRDLGTGVEVQAIVLYQLKSGTRNTLYLTPANLIKKETASGKTWSYKTETYTTGDIESITGTAVVGTGANWDADVAANDYFIMDYDHTAAEEPHRVVGYDAGDDGTGDIPDVGDTVTGGTSGATGKIKVITIDSGTFAGGDAAGDLILTTNVGTWVDDEALAFTDGETAVVNGTSAGAWISITTVTDDDNLVLGSEYTVKSNATLAFDSGSEEPSNGDVLDGATSSASGTVITVTTSSGTWGGGDAAGSITMQSCSGRFHDNEDVDINGGTANVLTVNQPNSAAGVDLIQNGEFSVDTDPPPGWTASGATLTTEGTGQVGNCMQVASSGAALGKAYQDITTVVGTAYKLSLYFKKGTSASGRYMIGITTDEDSIYDSTALTDAAWAAKSYIFEATATTTRITMETTDPTTTENSLFDEISLYEMPYGLDYKIRKVYTTPTNERWTWCIIDDMFIFTNGNTNVQKWTGAYASNLDATYAIKARYCMPYANRLFLADYGSTRDPLGIIWSKEGDPEDWTDSTAGSGILIETKDFITGLGVVGASLVIYKTDSLAFGHRTGVSATPVSIPQTRERRGIGCVAPYSIVDFMGTNAFIGRNDFYIIEGDYPVAIGGKIRDKFFDIVDLDDMKTVYGFENNITNEICWLASTSEGDLCFAWDYKLKEWNVYDFAVDLITAGKGAI